MDGFTVKIHKDFINQYYEICKKWEVYTKLNLEYVEYSKMVISDVNNYLSVTTKDKIKYKGKFEIDKVVGNEPAYHKNNSFRIIPIALQKFFINNISVEHTILNHTNIYDFCGRQKFKGKDYGETHTIDYDNTKNAYLKVEKQQKNSRYYISKDGATFIKQYEKGSSEFIHVGYKVTIFNKHIEKSMTNYNINYDFYIKECNKIINTIIDNQLKLF